VIREYPFSDPFTSTRIRSVLIGLKLIFRHTRLFPVTLPPGTSTHAVPVQYCTWKLVIPY